MNPELLSNLAGKRVLVTGHTGFKGSWLLSILSRLNAEIYGIALEPSTEPSLYSIIAPSTCHTSYICDVRDLSRVKQLFLDIKPDVVFHLAAQPIVRESYLSPVDTWNINVGGTINILESLRCLETACTAIFITSDKCYENQEWLWGYREIDQLGGVDPYSSSKAAAELAIASWTRSWFPPNGQIVIATARAGNVIGGGDWSKDRLIPDFVRAWQSSTPVEIRSPRSTRPWQHVLEPLHGYLSLAAHLSNRPELHGQSFNFGPSLTSNKTVEYLISSLQSHLPGSSAIFTSPSPVNYESSLLNLSHDKAFHLLGWYPRLDFAQTIDMTASWYSAYYSNDSSITQLIEDQIETYQSLL